MMIEPEAIIRVRFRSPTEGGRKTDIKGEIYSCPMIIDGEGFDCRIELPFLGVELGQTYDLAVQFRFPDLALQQIKKGVSISLWEGRVVADGRVTEIVGITDAGT